MAQKTFTSTSPDQDVLQQLFWDSSIGSIDVVHQINLDPFIGARLALIFQYKPGHPDYLDKCDEYQINPKNKIVITEYIYDEYEDARDYRMVETFPAVSVFYFLSGLPHLVVALVNKAGGNVSKTSGEAL